MLATGDEEAQFIFVACQAGAETALKAELARERPGFRFAFSRPGFLTFRSPAGVAALGPDLDIGSAVFARAYGLSLGKASSELGGAVAAKGREVAAQSGGRKVRLHVFERDRFPPGEEPEGFRAGGWASALKIEGGAFLEGSLAEEGDLVLDVVFVEESEIWFGLHRHDSTKHSPYPGGNPGLTLPADAPSRAWLKLEEALHWPAPPLREGETAIELGAAPGGAALALLSRGLRVVGIDSGEILEPVRGHRNFKWVRSSAKEALLDPRLEAKLPKSAEWLLLDIHARGELALRELEPYVRRYRSGLRGAVLTLKLGSWKMAELIPRWLEKVRAMGFVSVRAAQLPSNRQEFSVVALTEAGNQSSSSGFGAFRG